MNDRAFPIVFRDSIVNCNVLVCGTLSTRKLVCVWLSTVCVCMWTVSVRYFIEIKFVILYNAVYAVSLFETLLTRADSRDSFLPRTRKTRQPCLSWHCLLPKVVVTGTEGVVYKLPSPRTVGDSPLREQSRLPGREERSQTAEASSLSPNRICTVSLWQLHNSRSVNRERCAISFPCETGLGHTHAAGAGRSEGTEFQLCKMNKL